MHTTPGAARHAPLPVPDVVDSDFGAFEAALRADEREADALDAQVADTLLTALRHQHTSHGYTSWPAYAEALEVLVRRLVAGDLR